MAMPAVKYEPEDPLEDRVARLEVNVEHIAKIEAVDQRPTGKIDSLKDPLTTVLINIDKQFDMLRRARAFDRVLFLIMTGEILAVMAREFNWI